MTDISTIDIPTAVTALFAIVASVGGVLGKTYISKALGGITTLADSIGQVSAVLVSVGQLLITISKAGADGVLSPEEWVTIKDQARVIQADLFVLQGKLEAFKI